MSNFISNKPTLYNNLSLNPAFNRINYSFNSSPPSGSLGKSLLSVVFYSNYSTPPSFTALDGEYITINGINFYFKDNPKYGELTSSPFSNGNQAAEELYYILLDNPTTKIEYNVELVDVAGFKHIIIIANHESSTFDLTFSQSVGVSNIYTQNFPGSGPSFGSNSWNYGNYVNLFVSKDTFKRNLQDQTIYSVTGDNEFIILEKDFNGIENNAELAINFSVEEFCNKYIEVAEPFSMVNSFIGFIDSIIRYHLEYGEYYSPNKLAYVKKYPIGTYGKNDGFRLYGYYANLSNKFNQFNHQVDAEFEQYHFRDPEPSAFNLVDINYLLLNPLTNITNQRVSKTQDLYLGFIWTYIQFTQSSPILPQQTNLIVQYDVEFIDGTVLLDQYLTSSISTVNFATMYGVNISPLKLGINNIETIAGTLVNKFTVRVKEFLLGDIKENSRPVTSDFVYFINNDLRDYRSNPEVAEDNDEFGELIFLNSLGFWDTLFIHSEILNRAVTNNNIYNKTIDYSEVVSDMDVLGVNYETSYTVLTDLLNKSEYLWLQQELLKSPKIYLKQIGKTERVAITEAAVVNSSELDMQQFTLNLKPLLKENTF